MADPVTQKTVDVFEEVVHLEDPVAIEIHAITVDKRRIRVSLSVIGDNTCCEEFGNG